MANREMGGSGIVLMESGSLDAAEEAVTIDDLRGAGSAAVQLTGTFSGTVTFEVTVDGTNWVAVEMTTPAGAAAATTATGAGIFVAPVAGYRKFRARCSAYTSGTIVTTVNTSPAAFGPLP